jgi:hypothetical protein
MLAVDGILVDFDLVPVAFAAVPCFACHRASPSWFVA